MSMMATTKRRTCTFCSEELAPTAYFRHLHDKSGTVCPGKRKRCVFNDDFVSENDTSLDVKSPRTLDSTFEIESSDEETDTLAALGEEVVSNPNLVSDESFDGSSCYSYSEDSVATASESSGEEIWDVSEEEEVTNEPNMSASVNTVVTGISFFIVFFHLVYRLSERAANTLLGFVRTLIHFFAVITGHNVFNEIVHALPKTVLTLRAGFKANDYVEYVVCPKCNSLYDRSECVIDCHNRKESRRCTYVKFPNHPHRSKRNPCNEILLKRVKLGSQYKLIPRKVYVYRSLRQSLMCLAKRSGFLSKCDSWRLRQNRTGIMGDIYDGKLWNDLQFIGGRPFLSIPNNLCLGLNIDWFNPFEETPYSVGAIYLVVLNLPRNDRYKEENVILVGMIPGPNEPEQNINTFLAPLVHELRILFEGITFQNPSTALGYSTLRAVIACVTCDIPATRKVCGFSSFKATYGCSKCMKQFLTPSFGDKTLYGGFDCDNWIPRDMSSHRREALKSKNARTTSECKSLWRQSGIKYSELLELPHFDVVRSHVIDPMHCIFLGLAKHTIKTWKEKGVLQDDDFSLIQEKVNQIIPPSKIGRIPRKIEFKFASFTADEWKNWILIYSVFALNEVVGSEHFQCWCLLVDSCLILCQPLISERHVIKGHTLLVEFCKKFESLYGEECCTPNMHMACHLKNCLLDFGPFSAFWCFPYERYNGILEGVSKSWMSPEKQMFLKFLGMQHVKQLCESNSENDFLAIVNEQLQPKIKDDYSSLGQTQAQDIVIMQQMRNFSCETSMIDPEKKEYHCLLPPFKEKYFTDVELSYLQEMYSCLYPAIHVEKSRFYKEYKKCMINGEEYISKNSRSQRSTAIAAKWPNVIGIDERGEASVRIGRIISFLEHTITISLDNERKSYTVVLARLEWYGDHPRRHYLHSSVLICSTVFEPESSASFMPISRIMCRCAVSSPLSLSFDFGVDCVYVSVPLTKYRELSEY